MHEKGCMSLAREAGVEFQDASHWRDGSSGAGQAGKTPEVNHLYVQIISVKIPDKLFMVN